MSVNTIRCVLFMFSAIRRYKKYQEKSLRTITELLHMTVEDHTRKQVQMHSVARNITQRFSARVPSQFGDCFRNGKVFYSVLNGVLITVEEFVEGEFVKYVNNDGNCYESDSTELDEIFEKAQSLVHFSYEFTEKKMMPLDLQGSKYKLYDPEIATDQLQDFSGSEEYYFCAGNLTSMSIEKFISKHKCNRFCKMMAVKELEAKDE